MPFKISYFSRVKLTCLWENRIASKNETTLPWAWRLLSVKEFRRVMRPNVKKKRGLFSVPIPLCCSLVALPRNLPQLTSFWNFNQIPFRGTMFSASENIHWRAFAFRLGATHPCPIAVHTEPISTSVFKGYTWIVASSTKICTRSRSMPSHEETLFHLTSTPPYFRCWQIKSNNNETSYKPSAWASSFFRAGEFGRLVVTHYLAGADFHGHGPTV
jgi:hypothetical protein